MSGIVSEHRVFFHLGFFHFYLQVIPLALSGHCLVINGPCKMAPFGTLVTTPHLEQQRPLPPPDKSVLKGKRLSIRLPQDTGALGVQVNYTVK